MAIYRNFAQFKIDLNAALTKLINDNPGGLDPVQKLQYEAGLTLLRAFTTLNATSFGSSVKKIRISDAKIKAFFPTETGNVIINDVPEEIIDEILPRFNIKITGAPNNEITGPLLINKSNELLYTISEKLRKLRAAAESSAKIEEFYKIILAKPTSTPLKTIRIVLREKNEAGNVIYNAYSIEVDDAKIIDLENQCGIKIDASAPDVMIPLVDISTDKDLQYIKPISQETYTKLSTPEEHTTLDQDTRFAATALDTVEHNHADFSADFSSIISSTGDSMLKEIYEALKDRTNTSDNNQTYKVEFTNNIDTLNDGTNPLKRKYKFNINRASKKIIDKYAGNSLFTDMFKDFRIEPNQMEININLSALPPDYNAWFNNLLAGKDGRAEFYNKINNDKYSISGSEIRKPSPIELGLDGVDIPDPSNPGESFHYKFNYADANTADVAFQQYKAAIYNPWITSFMNIGTRDVSAAELRNAVKPENRKLINGYAASDASVVTRFDRLYDLLDPKNVVPEIIVPATTYRDTNIKYEIVTNNIISDPYVGGKSTLRLKESACIRFRTETGLDPADVLREAFGHAVVSGRDKCDRNAYIRKEIADRLATTTIAPEERAILTRLEAIIGTDVRDYDDTNTITFVGAIVKNADINEFMSCIVKLNRMGRKIEKVYPVRIDGPEPASTGIDQTYEREMQEAYSEFGINEADPSIRSLQTRDREIYPHEHLTWENGIPNETDDPDKIEDRFKGFNDYYSSQAKGQKMNIGKRRLVTGRRPIEVGKEKLPLFRSIGRALTGDEVLRAISDRDKTDGILENYDALQKGVYERLAINGLIAAGCFFIPGVSLLGAAAIWGGTQFASDIIGWVSRVRQTLLTNRVNDAVALYHQIQRKYSEYNSIDPSDTTARTHTATEIHTLYTKFAKAVRKVPMAQRDPAKITEINNAMSATGGTPTLT